MARELELKYQARDVTQAERVVQAILQGTGATAGEPRTEVLTTVYLDDEAGTLGRRGVALRRRSRAGNAAVVWGVKALASAPSQGSWDFVEWELPVQRDAPPRELARLCRALGAGWPLQPIAELVTERELLVLRSGEAYGELCVDRVSVRAPGAARFLEIELESASEVLLAEARRAVEGMAEPPLASSASKLEAALGARARLADPEVVALLRHEVGMDG
jgi:inorganic triphosphatase YgiF